MFHNPLVNLSPGCSTKDNTNYGSQVFSSISAHVSIMNLLPGNKLDECAVSKQNNEYSSTNRMKDSITQCAAIKPRTALQLPTQNIQRFGRVWTI